MPVHVLLFDPGSDQEGIHSIEVKGQTVVLLFEAADDAERYAGLLEAQDFPVPCVETLERGEVELFCEQAGYEARFVPAGFMPSSEEDRLLIAPPVNNMDVERWKEQDASAAEPPPPDGPSEDPEVEAFRRRLEGLL
ncbi:MAG: DUF3110 domain-containing protein [Cyanobacteria bacterium]|nr:DUF3110 domain-containing protein [Cyanobacteriota bacterium]